jgi:hypothetical protein
MQRLPWKLDENGFDFFYQESAVDNTWAATASGQSGGAPVRAGVEGFDLNSQVADGFPRLGEYGAFLLCDGDQLVGHGRGSGLPPQPPFRAPRSLGVPNQRLRGGSASG